MENTSDWCTIESDPGVFTELIERFGVKDVQVEEIYDLGEATFATLQPVYGLVFLFKWQQEEQPAPPLQDVSGLFFAKQVITNACATQAILSILLNCPQIDLGTELSNFASFTSDFPSDIKGLSIANSDVIREAHNSFARPEPFSVEEKPTVDDDQASFHFISYVPHDGKLYELDGLKPGPICLADDVTAENWIDKVRPVIEQRIQRYSSSEIRFNLMAVIKRRSVVLNDRIKKMTKRLRVARARLTSGSAASDTSDDAGAPLPASRDELQIAASAMEDEIEDAKQMLKNEESKRERWSVENKRRKHNYVPLVFALLQKLAENGKLDELVERAKEKQNRLRTERAASSVKPPKSANK